MKKTRFLAVLLAAAMLTACGSTDSDTATKEKAQAMAGSSGTDPNAPSPRLTADRIHYEFSETLNEDVTDNEILAMAAIENWDNRKFVDGYTAPDTAEPYTLLLVPEAEDFDGYISERFDPTRENSPVETVEDTDLYLLVRADQLYLIPKNFRDAGNGFAKYLGGTDEESFLKNFDLIATQRRVVCRRFRDDPTVKCFSYDFWDIRVEDGKAKLFWRCYLPDREDMMFQLEPEWCTGKEVDLNGGSSDPGSSSSEPAPRPDVNESEDITMEPDRTTLFVGKDSGMVLFYATPLNGDTPDEIQLERKKDGEFVYASVLVDTGEPELTYDDIAKDGIYTGIYQFNTDTAGEFEFRAAYTADGVTHISVPVIISIIEDKPSDKQKVDSALSEVTRTEKYRYQQTAKERLTDVEAVLIYLKEKGLVTDWKQIKDDYGEYVEFTYSDGSTGVVEIDSFIMQEDRLNNSEPEPEG